MIGKPENIRFLHIAMIQSTANNSKAALTIDMKASENPALLQVEYDPTIFCTGFKKNRFYLVSSGLLVLRHCIIVCHADRLCSKATATYRIVTEKEIFEKKCD